MWNDRSGRLGIAAFRVRRIHCLHAFTVSLCGTMLCAALAFPCNAQTAPSEENSLAQQITPLQRMETAETNILSTIQALESHASEIASLARQLNQIGAHPSNDPSRSDRLARQLYSD